MFYSRLKHEQIQDRIVYIAVSNILWKQGSFKCGGRVETAAFYEKRRNSFTAIPIAIHEAKVC